MTDLPTRLRTLAGGLTELAMSIWQLSSPGSELLVSDSATALLQAADALTLLSDTLSGAIKRARAAESKLDIAYSEQAKQLTQITAIRAKLAEAETARAEALRVRDRSDHYALAERARAEKAEAEAAALRDVLTHYADDNYFGVNYVYATEAREALSQPGPGAALLADAGRWRAFSADCTCGAARLHSSLFDTEKEKP